MAMKAYMGITVNTRDFFYWQKFLRGRGGKADFTGQNFQKNRILNLKKIKLEQNSRKFELFWTKFIQTEIFGEIFEGGFNFYQHPPINRLSAIIKPIFGDF